MSDRQKASIRGLHDPNYLYIVKDLFEDTGGTALTAHVPDKDDLQGGWLVAGASGNGGSISSGGVLADFGNVNEDRRNIIDTGVADFVLEARLNIVQSSFVGVCFSHSSAADAAGYVFYYQPGLNNVRLGRDSITVIQTGSPAQALVEDGSVYYTFRVEKTDDSILCYVNGVLVIDVTDSNYNGNHHGLFGWRDNGNRWREFSLEAI